MNGGGMEWAKIRVESVCADSHCRHKSDSVPYPLLCLLCLTYCLPAFSVESSSNIRPIMALQCEALWCHRQKKMAGLEIALS